MDGKIHSFQSFGAVDGPGIRFVVFMQGCPLRCACCHNPDTWDTEGGKTYSAENVASRVARYREYFGKDGGVTVSGGEPLLQAKFVSELFELCHKNGINTCLDSSGCFIDGDVKEMLDRTDRVLLDVKYTNEEDYEKYVPSTLTATLEFLSYLNEKKIAVTLRQVIIPTVNDTDENVQRLAEIANKYSCVDKVELLPFRKICTVKYTKLNLPFPFAHHPEPTPEKMSHLNTLLHSVLNK